jgi:AraC-like DNA-binding protein
MQTIAQILIYAGAIQGLLLSLGLFSMRTNITSNRILGMLTASWGVVLLIFALQETGLYQNYPHLLWVFDQLIFLFFPLLYLHTKYLISGQEKFQLNDLWHFLPLFLSMIAHLKFFLLSGDIKLVLLENPTGYLHYLQVFSDEVVVFQGFIYTFLSLKLIKSHKIDIKNFESTIVKRRINLLEIAVKINLLAWIIGAVGLHLDYLGMDLGFDYFALSYLAFVGVIYFISYASFKNLEIFKVDMTSGGLMGKSRINVLFNQNLSGKIDTSQSIKTEAISTNSLDNPRLLQLNEHLLNYMVDERPFLNSDLNLVDLAESLGVSRNDLSSVINSFHGKNFYEFINYYRVEEVKRLMKDSLNKSLKMTNYGYDSGFNSKASFYRIFKQITKKSPMEYYRDM